MFFFFWDIFDFLLFIITLTTVITIMGLVNSDFESAFDPKSRRNLIGCIYSNPHIHLDVWGTFLVSWYRHIEWKGLFLTTRISAVDV